MWHNIAAFIIKFRIALLVILLSITGIMGYYAMQVKLSYEFTSAVPTDNPKYIEYQKFRAEFGEDGNLMAIAVKTKDFFAPEFFNDYALLVKKIAKVNAVENVLSVPGAIALVKDTVTQKLKAMPIAGTPPFSNVDSIKQTFLSLPFYKGLLYNPDSNAYLMTVWIQKDVLNSKGRADVINEIVRLGNEFGVKHNIEMHYSGLPLIRTEMAMRVQHEMRLFLILSFVLTAVILALFFRSVAAVIASMLVVAIGVIWSVGTIELLGYKITLLTALIPPLVVVIGIPNCVYLLNRYHFEYAKNPNKMRSLLRMVDRMGIVTFFTNLTAGIGFGVFFFTKSVLLKEFGLVAGINILGLFFISLVFIPALFSFLPPPNVRHTSYLESGWINKLLEKITKWVFSHRTWIYAFTIVVCVFSVWGVMRLKNDAHIVDDLPKSDKIYLDLKFLENNFKGIMPLQIVIDTRKKNGVASLEVLGKMDKLCKYLETYPEIGRPLAITEGIKFANQAYFGGDPIYYEVPEDPIQAAFVLPYLRTKGGDNNSMFSKLLHSFVDSTKSKARISVNMADIGSHRLPIMLGKIKPEVDKIFDSTKYKVTFTGTSVTFLEGSKFIVNSLRDSLILAFLFIFGCMVAVFRSWRILVISIIVNIVPLLITAGLMGWMGIRIKPSTVLVFSVALGITIDVTIRFLVNFKQELAQHDDSIADTVHRTIRDTGLSIIYTSLILVAGFGVFALSQFDGTKSLGYLTSITLLLAMVTNLTLLPALLLWMDKVIEKKNNAVSFLMGEDEDDVIKM
ncbi:RND transporter [Flavipsychrobacter stenotrophus]|uniref:RND transporter n=1 Tax=Flavipsychrobacter stenotrophus TaxID=2077091 RepID=A0A2S7STB2_9BACT|nr:MMPL family transporter [Flavipsychrobacter stenotrophus]PQJ09835.1 RND transporter [Flavipsychrobacter stenotrophus]